MRSHINKLMTGLLAAVLSFSCTGADKSAAYGVADSKEMAAEAGSSSSDIRVGEEAIPERKLTKNGMLRFETSDAQKTRAAIQKAITEAKGYVASDSKDEEEGRQTSTVTLRVPSDRFDALVDRITAEAGKIDYKNIEVSDVTQEYIDSRRRKTSKLAIRNCSNAPIAWMRFSRSRRRSAVCAPRSNRPRGRCAISRIR